MVLSLAGRSVTRCSVDFAFHLLLDGESSVEISVSSFRLRDAAGDEYVLDAEQDRRLLAPALACFGLTVAHAFAYKSGRLEVAFTDGSRLDADPHPAYEAWQVSGPGNVLVVSPAGGTEPAVLDGTPGITLTVDDV